MNNKYDVICIGAGPAGYSAAVELAKANKKVALIEKNSTQAGGTCLNEGCIPVKALIKVSKLHHEITKDGASYGLKISSEKPVFKDIIAYTKKVSDSLRRGLMFLFKSNKIDFIEGEAEIINAQEIIVRKDGDELKLQAEHIILAMGSVASELPGFEYDGKQILSSKQALGLDEVPSRVLIVGGGAIGIEFASVFNNLGSEVKIVELKEHILSEEDKDVALCLAAILKKQSIDIFTNALVKINSKDSLIKGIIKKQDSEVSFEADIVLVSVGRKANIDIDALTKAGIKTEKGKVVVNNKMQTSLNNVYAIGDITHYPMLAHSAYKQADIAVKTILNQETEEININLIPNVVYSNYEFARVGLKEETAIKEKINYKTKKYSMRACGRAIASNYPEGFIKIVYETSSEKIIGAAILAHDASELIHQFVIAIDKNLTLKDIAGLVYAHPTFSEAVSDACRS
jgi:dihydrolipoamide dehydrogenase